MQKRTRIGITGGIGSGKTTVCRIFETLGIPVYSADEWAKWLIVHDPDIKQGMTDLCGPETYLPDGRYNRAHVTQIIFSNPDIRLKINALVHPAVERHGATWHSEKMREGAKYTLKEAALMIESGNSKHLDALIVVTAPEDVRVARVAQRDHLEPAQVRQRIAAQISEQARLEKADFVIHNDGTHALIPQVLAVHRALTT